MSMWTTDNMRIFQASSGLGNDLFQLLVIEIVPRYCYPDHDSFE